MTTDDRVAAALAAKTTKAACTVWIGACNTHGYGVVQIDGVVHLAHRLAYEAEYGPIPDDMGIDHRCRVRNCVTPEHLEPVSAAENARRGRRASSLAVGDTCANGHLIEAGGLYERPSGKTECRLCRQSESSRKGIQRPTTQRRVADTRAAHARAY